MAKQFTTKEAKQLLKAHKALSALLEDQIQYADKQKETAASVAANLVARNVFAQYVFKELSSGNINVSLPPDIQQLLRPLYRYTKSLPLSEVSRQLYHDTHDRIMMAMIELKPGAGNLQWLFTSGENKTRAVNAYTYLSETEKNSYAWQIQSVEKDIDTIAHQADALIFQDY